MAYGAVNQNIENQSVNPADRNRMAIEAGYTGLDDYYNNRRSTQSQATTSQQSSVSPQFSSDELNKAIAAAVKTYQTGNEPAIASYQASIPENQAKYAQASSQLTAQQQPLKDRYNTLLESIKNEGQQSTNKQTLITSNELGKRGILGSSTLAQQEIQNAVTPVQQQYSTLQKNAALDQTQAEQVLQNQIANLVPQETADTRSIQNAIAALQGGVVTQGVQTGSNLYGTQLQNTLANAQLAQQKQLAESQAAASQAQQAIANQIAQKQLENQTKQTQYDINKPYGTGAGGGGLDLSWLKDVLNNNISTAGWVNAQGQKWTDTNKFPIGTFTGKDGKTYTEYSDGSTGSTVWQYK